MTTPFEPVITQVGLTAALNAQQNGIKVEVTHIALGSGEWEPDETATALMAEEQRVPIASGAVIPPYELHLTALFDGPEIYVANEFAIIADNGTPEGVVIAIYSAINSPIAFKNPQVPIVFNHHYILTALPPGIVEFTGTIDLNLTYIAEHASIATQVVALQHRNILDHFTHLDHEARLAALEA